MPSILFCSLFSSSEKPVLIKAIEKPAEIHPQTYMHSYGCVCKPSFTPIRLHFKAFSIFWLFHDFNCFEIMGKENPSKSNSKKTLS